MFASFGIVVALNLSVWITSLYRAFASSVERADLMQSFCWSR